MKKFIYFLIFLTFVGCAGTKKVQYVPTQTEIRVEYRDSLVYVRDTIFITPPVEEKSIKTLQDSSHLETSIAVSDAWIDEDNNLNHTLKNKTDTVFKYVYDTVVVSKIVKEYVDRPVIVEVEVPVKYIPKAYKYSMWFSLSILTFFLIKIFLTLKRKFTIL